MEKLEDLVRIQRILMSERKTINGLILSWWIVNGVCVSTLIASTSMHANTAEFQNGGYWQLRSYWCVDGLG